MDCSEGPYVIRIIEKLVLSYPSAMFYIFKSSSEFLGTQGLALTQYIQSLFNGNSATDGSRNSTSRNADINKEESIMKDCQSMDCFVEALYGLTHPELRWSDSVKNLQNIFNSIVNDSSMATNTAQSSTTTGTKKKQTNTTSTTKSTSDSMNIQQLLHFFETISDTSISLEWSKVGTKIGNYNRQWIQTYSTKILNIIGEIQATKLAKNPKETMAQLNKLTFKEIKENHIMKFPTGKVSLNEFSEWLAEFDPMSHNIEIPGQYDYTMNKPPPEPHEREYILNIDPYLLVMSSIRKPKRIIFYSTHGKEYKFLVKGGEDLRNDQRIQQLFDLFNSLMRQGGDNRFKDDIALGGK